MPRVIPGVIPKHRCAADLPSSHNENTKDPQVLVPSHHRRNKQGSLHGLKISIEIAYNDIPVLATYFILSVNIFLYAHPKKVIRTNPAPIRGTATGHVGQWIKSITNPTITRNSPKAIKKHISSASFARDSSNYNYF